MRPLIRVVLITLALGLALPGWAQSHIVASSQTLIILPFENQSKAPGLEWIGESFPEVLGRTLKSPRLYVVSREDRLLAFDRAAIPGNVHLSRATLFRIVEQMDTDYAVLGDFKFDGQTFTAEAQLLDMKGLKLSPVATESGPLVKLIEVQTALAWDLLKLIEPREAPPRETFMAASPAIRLDAFENYVRGITSAEQNEAVRHFREAIRLAPDYYLAMNQLGLAYFNSHDYEQAATWLSRIPKTDPLSNEANFYLGLSEFYLGDFEKSEAAFGYLASQMPLTEVYNNLGVAEARRGKRSAIEQFQKAVKADPSDPDYHFNLAVALYRAGDFAGAARQLRETTTLRPDDGEARSMLNGLGTTAAAALKLQEAHTSSKAPLERIKRNYDESSFQMLALDIQNVTEMRLAQSDPRSHAEAYIQRGHELLQQELAGEAEKYFREAVQLQPSNSTAHAGLAHALELAGSFPEARQEAETSLHLSPSVEAMLVLVRLDIKENQPSKAASRLDAILAIEPNNAAALALKRSLESGKTQSQ